MTEHSLWRFSRALHRAINERQMADIEELIDDDVDWAIYGPIDMFPFLGQRRGKAAVMEVIPPGRRERSGPPLRSRIDHVGRGFRVVDAAVSSPRWISNKPISLRLAHFAQFRAGKLISFRVLLDRFDLVEQTVGYPIHLPRMAV